MFHQIRFGREFFVALERMDEEITRRVAAGHCPRCGGPLHRGDWRRKPCGALIAPEGEASVTRFGLCCGREGCRRRATPPSLRFLGRRVYLGAVVIVASMVAQAISGAAAIERRRVAAAIKRQTGVPARTTRRWLGWWCGSFVTTEVFVTVCARLIGVAVEELPASIVLRLAGSPIEKVRMMLELMAPLTTSSVRDGASFLRGAP